MLYQLSYTRVGRSLARSQPKNVFAVSYQESGTSFSSAVASVSGTDTISSPWSAAI